MPDRVDWSSPDDETVKVGLGLTCGACKAAPGEYCRNTVNGRPLIELHRLIHFYRLDKSMKADKEDT